MKTLEEVQKALDAANEKIATLDVQSTAHAKAVADMETRAKAAEEKAEALKSALDEAKAGTEAWVSIVKGVRAALGEPQAKLDEKGEPMKNEKGEAVYETLPEQAERLAGEMIARDVDALIPTKLDPAQKDEFVALAKSDRSLFDRIVKGLPERKLLGAVMPATKIGESTISADDDGSDFAGEVQRSLDGENVGSDEGDFGDELADDDGEE